MYVMNVTFTLKCTVYIIVSITVVTGLCGLVCETWLKFKRLVTII